MVITGSQSLYTLLGWLPTTGAGSRAGSSWEGIVEVVCSGEGGREGAGSREGRREEAVREGRGEGAYCREGKARGSRQQRGRCGAVERGTGENTLKLSSILLAFISNASI